MMKGLRRALSRVAGERGYVMLIVMGLLLVMMTMLGVLAVSISINQAHVDRDRTYTESLEVAEAGLNRYLWMVASRESSELNGFEIPGADEGSEHEVTCALENDDGKTMGTYTMVVTPPLTDPSDPLLRVTVTGSASGFLEAPRTVTASIGRPSFSEYVMLTDDPVYIGGNADNQRKWWGRTHSNTSIRIDTYNINDMITCSNSSYGGHDGVYSNYPVVTSHPNSEQFWDFPVPLVDFDTVTADFDKYRDMATASGHAYPEVEPQSVGAAHGWYIKLSAGNTYQVAQVTEEYERNNYDTGGTEWGGYLRYEYQEGVEGSLSDPILYPANGVIFVSDNVWVEGTGVTGRITIAATGQFNSPTTTADVNIVGDLTYAALDGSAAIGLVAQRDVKIPMYAPRGRAGTPGTNYKTGDVGDCDMTIHAALIAQTGREYANREAVAGPRRGMLTIIGSISSLLTPSRAAVDTSSGLYGGFGAGANEYDPYLLHNPPPSFPTVGSYQLMDWQELPSTQSVGE